MKTDKKNAATITLYLTHKKIKISFYSKAIMEIKSYAKNIKRKSLK